MADFFPVVEPQNIEGITQPDVSTNPPIILIPGVCGSILVADNNEVAWLNETLTPYPQTTAKLMQYLYGVRDPRSNEFISFIERQGFSSVKAVPGLPGCSKLLNHKITKLPGIVNKKLGVYYETFAAHLSEVYGYCEGINLFAFTYDWRQPLHAQSIQQALDELLKSVCSRSGTRCIVVGHSMGGLLVTTYMRLHPDWNSYISKFISLGAPYGGSGASGLIAAPYGYNLRMPFRPRVARGLQGPGGSMACLNLPAIDMAFRSCMFLRIAHTRQEPQELSISAFNKSSTQATDTAQDIPVQVSIPVTATGVRLKLNRQVYKNKTPDIPALLLMEIEANPDCIEDNFEQVITLLAQYCEPGFVAHPPIKTKSDKFVPFEAALDAQDPPYPPVNELPPDANLPWQWAVYSPGMDIYPHNTPIHGFADLTTMQEDEQKAEVIDDVDYNTVLKETEVPELRHIIWRASLRDQNISLRSVILQHCLLEVGTGRVMVSSTHRHLESTYNGFLNLNSMLTTDSADNSPSVGSDMESISCAPINTIHHTSTLQSTLGAAPIFNPLTNTIFDGPSRLVDSSFKSSSFSDHINNKDGAIKTGADYVNSQDGDDDASKTEQFFGSIGRAFKSPHYNYKSRLQAKDNFKKMIIIVKDMVSQYRNNIRQHTDDSIHSLTPSSTQSTSMTTVSSEKSTINTSTTSNRFLYRPVSTLNFKEIGGPEIQEQYSQRCIALLHETRALPYADLLAHCVKSKTLDALIYKPSLEYWEQSKKLLQTSIVYPEDESLFRFYSLNGSNLQTAIHAYYDEILSNVSEIAFRQPKFIFGIGDGTVPLASSLSDPIPNRYVDDRVAFPQMGHFEMLQSEDVFNLLTSFMELQPVSRIRKSKQ